MTLERVTIAISGCSCSCHTGLGSSAACWHCAGWKEADNAAEPWVEALARRQASTASESEEDRDA